MSNKKDDFLFQVYQQQYNQYRHLDDLRRNYIYFYFIIIGTVTSISLFYATKPFPEGLYELYPLYFLLAIFGYIVFIISITIRDRQWDTAKIIIEVEKQFSEKSVEVAKVVSRIGQARSGFAYHPKESSFWLILLIFLGNSIIIALSFTLFFLETGWQTKFMSLLCEVVKLSLGIHLGVFIIFVAIRKCNENKRENFRKEIEGDLEHISNNSDTQKWFRCYYYLFRMENPKKQRTYAITDAAERVRKKFPDFQPNYDRGVFERQETGE